MGFLGSIVVTLLRANQFTVVPVSRRQSEGIITVDDYAQTPVADVIVHLAEEADRAKVNRLGQAYADHSTEVLRKLVRRTDHVIYASSSTVYGDAGERPFTVEDPVLTTDFYSSAKFRNEQIALEADASVLRFSNLCGIGMSAQNVLSDILTQVPGKGPLKIRDDMPVRDFLPVLDAATAVVMTAQRRAMGLLNVGSGIGISIRDLAQVALQLAHQADREIVATSRSGRRSMNVLDIDHTRLVLDWAPRETVHQFLFSVLTNGVSP